MTTNLIVQNYRKSIKPMMISRLFLGIKPKRAFKLHHNHPTSSSCCSLSSSVCPPSSAKKQVIGFVGLGNMGLPMCKNLLESSSSNSTSVVVAYDTNPRSIQQLITTTKENVDYTMPIVRTVSSLTEMIQSYQPNVLITVLPNCNASRSVLLESLELFANNDNGSTGDRGGCTFIDCSTISVATSRANHKSVQNASSTSTTPKDAQYRMVDAPMSGGVRGAQDGTLTFMVGTNDASTTNDDNDSKVGGGVMEVVEPVLTTMGNTIKLCGGPGNGIVAKLCNNLALAIQMIGISEAMNLGSQLGINPITLAECLNTSTASCWSSKVNNPDRHVSESLKSGAARHDYEGGFAAELMLKDLTLALGEHEIGENDGAKKMAMPMGAQAKELYQLCASSGLGKKDFGVMKEFLRGLGHHHQ